MGYHILDRQTQQVCGRAGKRRIRSTKRNQVEHSAEVLGNAGPENSISPGHLVSALPTVLKTVSALYLQIPASPRVFRRKRRAGISFVPIVVVPDAGGCQDRRTQRCHTISSRN